MVACRVVAAVQVTVSEENPHPRGPRRAVKISQAPSCCH